MNARQARKRREELEAEIQTAAHAHSQAAQEVGAAAAALEALRPERTNALADAARGLDGASARAEDLDREIALQETKLRAATERAEAGNNGRASAQAELKRHVYSNRQTFLADASKNDDAADRDMKNAIRALEAARDSRAASVTEHGVIESASRSIAHESLGEIRDPQAIDELLRLAVQVERPEPLTPTERTERLKADTITGVIA